MSQAARPRVHIVIVNWNTGPLLRDCLASLAATARQHWQLARVTVVDNASQDDSLTGLDALDLPLRILRNTDNRGFGAACNQGAAGVETDLLLFLNPDTRLEAESIDRACAFLLAPGHERIGICGIQLRDDSGAVQRSCARFPGAVEIVNEALGLARLAPQRFPGLLRHDWAHDDSRVIDHVIGAFFLVRQPLFAALGGFDERYFVYLEDLDFSRRAADLGWQSYYLAEAVAWHKGGGSSEQVKARRTYYMWRSRILYGYRHLPRARALGLTALTLGLEPLARYGHALLRRAPQHAAETTAAAGMLWRDALQGRLAPARMLRRK